MVDVAADHRKQVPQATLDFLDASCELGQPSRKLRKPLRLEGAVHQDASALAKDGAQRSDELAPGIAVVGGQEFVVLGFRSKFPQHVNRPLKRNLVVGTHAREL